MVCRVIRLRCSAWTSTSAVASLSVSASATHPQEQDTVHDTAMTAYACIRGPRRSRATRRRSRCAATRATTRRAARASRSIRSAIVDRRLLLGRGVRANGKCPEPGGRQTNATSSRVEGWGGDVWPNKTERHTVSRDPVDDRIHSKGALMWRTEIEAALRAFREWPGYLGTVRTQASEWKFHPAPARFQERGPEPMVSRVPVLLWRSLLWRVATFDVLYGHDRQTIAEIVPVQRRALSGTYTCPALTVGTRLPCLGIRMAARLRAVTHGR